MIVGIPRALGYYDYWPLWKTFLRNGGGLAFPEDHQEDA